MPNHDPVIAHYAFGDAFEDIAKFTGVPLSSVREQVIEATSYSLEHDRPAGTTLYARRRAARIERGMIPTPAGWRRSEYGVD